MELACCPQAVPAKKNSIKTVVRISFGSFANLQQAFQKIILAILK
jgi:hypothetical protein